MNHLGVIDTDIWRNMPCPLSCFFDMLRKSFLKTIEEGIQTTLYAAMAPQLDGVTGKYLSDCAVIDPRSDTQNRQWQNDFWNKSKEMVKLTENDPQI